MRFRISLGLIFILGFVLSTVTGAIPVITQEPETPAIRMSHAMVFDPYNEVVVLFGGMTSEGGLHSLGDTWTYSYELNLWTELELTTSPSVRSMHNMVYCNATNEIILYGGYGYLDTWSFDCTTQTWSQVMTSENPGVHYNLGMAYDSRENVVVLFGGFGSDGWEQDDTWIFNCTTREWSEVFPVESPLARYGMGMVYDESVERVVLTCGNTASQGHQQDTWWYDVSTNTWEEQTTTGVPDRLKWPSMTFDSKNQICILFGGQIGDDKVDHTWHYDAQQNTWLRRYPDAAPSDRITAAFAFDSKNNVSILFGGGGQSDGPLGETWSYTLDTNVWTDMSTVSVTTTTTTTTTKNTTTGTTEPPYQIPFEIIAIGVAIPILVIIGVLFMKKRE